MLRSFILLFLFICGTPLIFCQSGSTIDNGNDNITAEAQGLNKTTGEIGRIDIVNSSDKSFVTERQYVFIASRNGYQSYVAVIPDGIVIPPGTSSIPLFGVCTDVTKPPIPKGESFPPMDEWIPVAIDEIPSGIFTNPNPTSGAETTGVSPIKLVNNKSLPAFSTDQIPSIMSSPGFTSKKEPNDSKLIITYPGTDIPITGTIDPDKDPDRIPPLIVEIVKEIAKATVVIQNNGDHLTPFASNFKKEQEAITQQTSWIVMAELTDEDYDKSEFSDKVYDQFTDMTGFAVTDIEEEQQEQINVGIEDFWISFVATGVEAKVLKAKEGQDPEQVPDKTYMTTEETQATCTSKTIIRDTGEKLDFDIAKTGTEDINVEIMESFKAAIKKAAGTIKDEKINDTIDIGFNTPEMPASVWSLYFPHTVAGQANASAFSVDLSNPHKSAWTTEPIDSKASGQHTVILTHNAPENCTSTLIGLNTAKLRAASGMDQVLTSIDELAVVNFLGEIAIDYIITRGKGKAKKLGKYIKEKVKGLAKEKAKEKIKEEMKKINDQLKGKTEKEQDEIMDELLKDIKDGKLGEEEEEDFLQEWIAEKIVEGKDFNPAEKIIGDQLDKIDSPIDWAPIKTNTYAMIEGKLQVMVESNIDSAKVASAVRYKRKELEPNEEAVKGGGVFKEGALAKKTTSKKITVRTLGNTESFAGATGEGIIDTGHGVASASLESFNAIYIVAICECPGVDAIYETYYSATVYTANPFMAGVWASVFEDKMKEAMEEYENGGSIGEIESNLEKKAKEANSIILRN